MTTRATILDRLEDEFGIKPDDLTKREMAIIGLAAGNFFDGEIEALKPTPPSKCDMASVVEPQGTLCNCNSDHKFMLTDGDKYLCCTCKKPIA